MTRDEWNHLKYGDVLEWLPGKTYNLYMFIGYEARVPRAINLAKPIGNNVITISPIPERWKLRDSAR